MLTRFFKVTEPFTTGGRELQSGLTIFAAMILYACRESRHPGEDRHGQGRTCYRDRVERRRRHDHYGIDDQFSQRASTGHGHQNISHVHDLSHLRGVVAVLPPTRPLCFARQFHLTPLWSSVSRVCGFLPYLAVKMGVKARDAPSHQCCRIYILINNSSCVYWPVSTN